MSSRGGLDLDEQTKLLQELSSMILHTPPIPLPTKTSSPAAFGSLFVGISMALMLFGSLTFLIGFILMPLAITLLLLFYSLAFVSRLSQILWPTIHNYNYSNNNISPAWTIEPELYPLEEQRNRKRQQK